MIENDTINFINVCTLIQYQFTYSSTHMFSDSWIKVSSQPVCFGARRNNFGRFNVPFGGDIAAIKLVHLSGYVTCDRSNFSYWSYWGCGKRAGVEDFVGVTITTVRNTIITPEAPFLKVNPPGRFSDLPPYESFSPEIILPRFSPYQAAAGTTLRLWYGEDLVDFTESDNDGSVCCDVYALYV